MIQRRIPFAFWRTVAWTGLLIALLVSVKHVQADGSGIPIRKVTQEDLNGDGQPDLTIIDCSFATEHDIIYVIDQEKDMQRSSDWQRATDFTNDIWLYDIGADGSIQLIVVYKTDKGHATADVYDDRDGDGQVKYERTGTDVTILESPYWIAHLISDSNWFLPDGRVNLNIRIQIDGPVPTLDRAPQFYIRDWLKQDGLVDVEFEEVAGSDGIAQYALKRLDTDSPSDGGFERAGLYSNNGHYPTGLPERAFFPFLPIPVEKQGAKFRNMRYFDLPPNLTIDWIKGKVLAVGLDGYPIGDGYHFNDNQYIVKGQVNDVSFESPQAYYDLANNHDDFPEAHIRFFTRPANDQTMWALPGKEAIPWQSIRYDWNLFNPGTLRWDFKIGVGGNYVIDSIVHFRDFAVRTVPFEQLPYWITDRVWKSTTFVAREGDGYESSEGIYEWQTDTGDDPQVNPERAIKARDATFGYMLGTLDQPPDGFFQTTHPGFRAERHLTDSIKPRLYFSPLDHKLHLQGAEAGLWTIDEQHIIRYANLNQDDYLDQWSYFENSLLRQEFYWTQDYLVYAGQDEIWLKRATVPAALFETLPPRNHKEWLAQRQMLEENQPKFAPEDFKAMLAQFQGLEWKIRGATMRDFRLDGQGFRFILQLQPGFEVIGSGQPDLAHLSSGAYLVSYQDQSSFTIKPFVAAKPSAALLPVSLTQLQLSSLPVKVWNDGLEDLPEVTLQLWAKSPSGKTSLVGNQTVELLAQTSSMVKLAWAPASSGTWVLTPIIREPNGRLTSGDPVSIVVAGSQNQNPLNSLFISASPRRLPVIVLGLILLATLTALVFWNEWGQILVKEETQVVVESQLPKLNEIRSQCPYCQAQEKQNKAGFNRSGSQRYRCRQCKRVYTPYPKSIGYPVETRLLAIQMYMDGNNFKTIGQVLKISRQTIIKWVKQYVANSTFILLPEKQHLPEVDELHSPVDMKSIF